jgi:subtilase family serine protease
MRKSRRRRWIAPQLDHLDDRCLLSGFTPGSQTGLTPAQITRAYGLNGIQFTSNGTTVPGNGAGETIALIEMYHDPNIQSDLATFDAQYKLPTPAFTQVNQAGDQTSSGWAQEESLDVEWAHAIAPGASILTVEAAPANSASQQLQNLLTAVNTARNTPGVVAVSMSWGFDEMPNESSFDSYFTTPAGHTGITFIAASGDNGYVEYPSASPNVLSVGGTSLTLTSTGAYGSETAWIQSGGGYSQFEPEPSYQASVQTTGMRSTPDVAFDGDPNTGVEVYATNPGFGRGGGWQLVGGTSVGAPAWAGIIAIVDQGRTLAGPGSLDGPTQTLPSLYKAPSADFNTVAAASAPAQFGNGFDPFASAGVSHSAWGIGFGFYFGFGTSPGSPGATTAGATANTSTGLGSPKGDLLVADLASRTLTVPLTIVGNSSGQTGSTPTPARPKGGGSKHHHKRAHRAAHTPRKGAAAHRRGLVKQGDAAPRKNVRHHSRPS